MKTRKEKNKKGIIALSVVGIAAFFSIGGLFLSIPIIKPPAPKIPESVTTYIHIQHCTGVSSNANQKISQLSSIYEKHRAHIAGTVDMIDASSVTLAAKGYDVSRLREKLNEFKEYTEGLTYGFENGIHPLADISENACDKTDSQLREEMAEMREQMEWTKDDIEDMKSFYHNELRKEIKAVAEQKIIN